LAAASLTDHFESMAMRKFLASLFLPILLIGQSANSAEPLLLSQPTGRVQQWTSDSASITVQGKTYEMTQGVVFMDGASKPLSRGSLKTGVPVMLMVDNGKVTHVIVNPLQSSALDRPSR
jgi:hypothetical protein